MKNKPQNSGEYLTLCSIADIVFGMNVGDGAPPFTQAQLDALSHFADQLQSVRDANNGCTAFEDLQAVRDAELQYAYDEGISIEDVNK